ncbi:hypothetical protein CAEBREN_13712 [Caenorhabditis brenneri]|uniref:Uncharacterized protein n=1 Tax=Caenorhabditis brenneri TaxID=135651 RepID=G0PH18_CAEBE|nr:hypothetical protein CAEBREN_13712 [Caenorhabditis brenneri]
MQSEKCGFTKRGCLTEHDDDVSIGWDGRQMGHLKGNKNGFHGRCGSHVESLDNMNKMMASTTQETSSGTSNQVTMDFILSGIFDSTYGGTKKMSTTWIRLNSKDPSQISGTIVRIAWINVNNTRKRWIVSWVSPWTRHVDAGRQWWSRGNRQKDWWKHAFQSSSRMHHCLGIPNFMLIGESSLFWCCFFFLKFKNCFEQNRMCGGIGMLKMRRKQCVQVERDIPEFKLLIIFWKSPINHTPSAVCSSLPDTHHHGFKKIFATDSSLSTNRFQAGSVDCGLRKARRPINRLFIRMPLDRIILDGRINWITCPNMPSNRTLIFQCQSTLRRKREEKMFENRGLSSSFSEATR